MIWSSKCIEITQVLPVKNMIKKVHGIASALSLKRWRFLNLDCEVEEEKLNIPADVPEGHNPIYVGSKRKRFIIPTTYLNHPLFRALLRMAEEEFGFDHHMGLVIPCDEVTFKYVTSIVARIASSVRR